MSLVKKNIAANFFGNGLTALLALFLIPLYIKFLGVEAWGVIAIFTTLQTLSFLLDLGLSSTLNRETARLSLQENNGPEMRDLVRTLELIYWAMAIIIGVSVFVLAPLIANQWLHARVLSPTTIQNAIRLMGLALFFQSSFTLYSGGLLGLQRMVLLSSINVVSATARGVGAVLILWKISATLEAFFLWYVVTGLFQTVLTRTLLWRSLPGSDTAPRFRRELLHQSWRFAAGISGITILSLIFTQVDKLVLSRMLSLEMFGYYVLASSVATSLYLLSMPVFYALYPRFTQLVALGDQDALREIYHHSCQLMSVLLIPLGVIIVLFSREILTLWTGNATTVEYTYQLLSLLTIGAAVNGLLHLPNALQLAHGWTKLLFYLYLISVLLLTPLIIVISRSYGAVGAAITVVSFVAVMTVVTIHLMHRRILKGEQWRWYLVDVGLPLSVSLGASLFCRALAPVTTARFQLLITLGSISLFVIAATALATPVTREALFNFFRSRQRRVLRAS